MYRVTPQPGKEKGKLRYKSFARNRESIGGEDGGAEPGVCCCLQLYSVHLLNYQVALSRRIS